MFNFSANPFWEEPWSDNPYAPPIPYKLHFIEKANFAGFLIGAIFYGIVIVLFFQCMVALLDPADPRAGTKWPYVAHVLAMFSFATVLTTMTLRVQSISLIDNREFRGGNGLPPGPVGYYFFIYSNAINVVPKVMLLLNTCLADGLLLYRCYVTYRMNYLVIVFPCLVYLAAFAMGIVFIHQILQPNGVLYGVAISVGIPFFSISVSLNVLLTLMISIRLILHSRDTQAAMGAPAGVSGLYKTVISMLIESCALYAVNSLLFIIPWAAGGSWVAVVFLPLLAEIQVIAPFLLILRAARQSASMSDTPIPTSGGSIYFWNQGRSTDGSDSLPEEESTS